jgi:hypothetical protein
MANLRRLDYGPYHIWQPDTRGVVSFKFKSVTVAEVRIRSGKANMVMSVLLNLIGGCYQFIGKF